MREDLKPCPFCGSKAELCHEHDLDSGDTYSVACTNNSNIKDKFRNTCPIHSLSFHKHYNTPEEAIAAWNQRVEYINPIPCATETNFPPMSSEDIIKLREIVDAWIPCSERLPKHLEDVIGHDEKWGVIMACYNAKLELWFGRDGVNKITHWQPLPEAPTEY